MFPELSCPEGSLEEEIGDPTMEAAEESHKCVLCRESIPCDEDYLLVKHHYFRHYVEDEYKHLKVLTCPSDEDRVDCPWIRPSLSQDMNRFLGQTLLKDDPRPGLEEVLHLLYPDILKEVVVRDTVINPDTEEMSGQDVALNTLNKIVE